MNYKTNYQRYKMKYLKMKAMQIAGGHNEAILSYNSKDNTIHAQAFPDDVGETEIIPLNLPTNLKNITDHWLKSNDIFFKRFELADKVKYIIFSPTKKIVAITDQKDTIIGYTIYSNNDISTKVFLLRKQNTEIVVTLFDFITDDLSFTTGQGQFSIQNNDIAIDGECKISRSNIKGIRKIIFKVKVIICQQIKFNLDFYIDDVQDIYDFLIQTNTTQPFKRCKEMIANLPIKFDNKASIHEHILNTICGKLYYYLPYETIQILIKYSNVVKLIIQYDFGKIISNLGTHINDTINEIPKYLPSDIQNKYILIKDKSEQYVSLTNNFTIIFDTGNTGPTIIGRNIVDMLQLPISKGCVLESVGIGGHIKRCGDYVEISFKFADYYHETNKKIYNLLGFVDDKITNTLLFGHYNGLDLLFDDNYSIGKQYDKDDAKEKKQIHNIDRVKNAYEKVNNYLDEFILNPLKNQNILIEMLKEVDPNYLHYYYSAIPKQLIKNTFQKLDNVKKIIKDSVISDKRKQTLTKIIKKYISG